MRRILFNRMLIVIAMFIPYACGISTQMKNIVSFIELAILLWLYNDDEFWLLTPVLFIFFPQFLLIGTSISLYNVYCGLCVFKLITEVQKFSIRGNESILWMTVLILYSAVVCMCWRTIWEGVILALQGLALISVTLSIKRRKHLNSDMKKIFIVTCLNAALFGLIFKNVRGNYELTDKFVQINVRYSGTTDDPSYMAFFYCIAICYVLFMNGTSGIKKIIGFLLLFVATALTGSLTALVTILIIVGLYIILEKNLKPLGKIFSILLVVSAGIFFFTYITTDFMQIDVLETYKTRILEKTVDVGTGEFFNTMTSGRANLHSKYIEFFFQQNIFRILFGGYQINTHGGNGAPFIYANNSMPHNTYIDVMFTCGLVGLVIFLFVLASNIRQQWVAWKKGNSDALTNLVYACSCTVFIYGLSVFPGTNYMYFLML